MRRRSSLLAAILLVAVVGAACAGAAVGQAGGQARIVLGQPTTLDPAAAGDAGSSALTAQFFESLTAFDPDLELQPALAESWRVEDEGRRVIFHIRPGLTFSDGSPLRAADVVRSWLRIIDPSAPSPLATIMLDVAGAFEYVTGQAGAEAVGLRADDAANDVIVDLVRPAAEFPTIVSCPTFGIVPEGLTAGGGGLEPGDRFVASGGYTLAAADDATMTLVANQRYWAGTPAIATITVVTDLAGDSPVAAFERGDVDYTGVSSFDSSWLAYDATLGPQLRSVPSLSTDYFGFDTGEPPFDDVRVRQAFGKAVDWRRIARLGVDDPAAVANSMVPPGIPDRTDRDMLPAYDPDAARALLAEAGYPAGRGFPDVRLVTGGTGYDEAIVTELERELGIDLGYEAMEFDDYFPRLDEDPPAMWALSWVADYPGRNDFLGVLLGSGSTSNYGRWSSPEFDAAIAEAGATADPAATAAAYDRAEEIVQRDVPVVPISYGTGWALAREGLLGAGQNGLGTLRFAGLAWAP